METQHGIVTLAKFNGLLDTLISKIQADETFSPDTILALSTGGFPVAAALAKRLDIRSQDVVGLPVHKDEHGDYHLDDRIVTLGSCAGRQVLAVDESSYRGLLTAKASATVEEHGGVGKSSVLIAWEGGIQPDFVAENCPGKPPQFYWEAIVG